MTIDFIILGAQKAATSALQVALRSHPKIYMPKGESAFFEDPDYADQPWEKLFSGKDTADLYGIKRPDNLCSDRLCDRIATHLLNARFIIVLREPVSRAISSYCYLLRHAHLPALSLNEGLAQCLEDFEAGRDTAAASVVTYGLYGRYLQKWYDKFPRDRFLILSHEQVSKDAKGALELCAHHLEIDPAPLMQALSGTAMRESNVGLYDPAMLRIARIGSLLKTRPIPNTRRRIPRSLPPRLIGTAITRFSEQLARWRGQNRETLSPELAQWLAEIYDADMQLLRQLAPKDALYWCTQP